MGRGEGARYKKPFSKTRTEHTKLEDHLLEDKFDVEAAKRADQDIKKHGAVKWKEAKKELGL